LPLTLQLPTAAPVGEYRLFTEFLLSVVAKTQKKTRPSKAEAAQ
jgi:hypothetical protein